MQYAIRTISYHGFAMHSIEGAIDSLTSWGATGWAWVPASPEEEVEIEAVLDGRVIGKTLADQARPDLVNQGKGAGRCGFVLTFAEAVTSEAKLLVRACGPQGTVILSGDEWSNVLGYVDALTSWGAVGWAWMPGAPNRAVEVEAVVKGNVIGRVFANQMRDDLAASGRGSGRYGFTLMFDIPLISGEIPELRVSQPDGLTYLRSANILVPLDEPTIKGLPEPSANELHSSKLVGTSAERTELLATEPDQARQPAPLRIQSTRFDVKLLFDHRYVEQDDTLVRKTFSQDASGGEEQRTISTHFDREYYLSMNPDVAGAPIDALAHFVHTGWREGRNPTPWFDTKFYLQSGPDVRSANINPFWHYLVAGQNEGRLTRRAGGFRRERLDDLKTSLEKTNHYVRRQPTVNPPDFVEEILTKALGRSRGLVVALSHDNYKESTGGVQIFISDEETNFRRDNMTFCHLFPSLPYLSLTDQAACELLVSVTIDGRPESTLTMQTFCGILTRSNIPERRFLVLHSVLGFSSDSVVRLIEALQPLRSFWWLHDYTALCNGYHLLRNDVYFCGAPTPESMACRVCIYGEDRAKHLASVNTIFRKTSMTVVSPSRAALMIFTTSTMLSYEAAVVREHASVKTEIARMLIDPTPRGSEANPVRVAFIGYKNVHKGWPIFEELFSTLADCKELKFYHFGIESVVGRTIGAQPVVTRTSENHRDAMTHALAFHDIDLVLVLSIWPETFSYVAFEALASGADIIAFKESGNVADVILNLKRGIVVEDEKALKAFFRSGAAVRYVRLAREQGRPKGNLTYDGTTAALIN